MLTGHERTLTLTKFRSIWGLNLVHNRLSYLWTVALCQSKNIPVLKWDLSFSDNSKIMNNNKSHKWEEHPFRTTIKNTNKSTPYQNGIYHAKKTQDKRENKHRRKETPLLLQACTQEFEDWKHEANKSHGTPGCFKASILRTAWVPRGEVLSKDPDWNDALFLINLSSLIVPWSIMPRVCRTGLPEKKCFKGFPDYDYQTHSL